MLIMAFPLVYDFSLPATAEKKVNEENFMKMAGHGILSKKKKKKMYTISKTGPQNVLVGHNFRHWQRPRAHVG